MPLTGRRSHAFLRGEIRIDGFDGEIIPPFFVDLFEEHWDDVAYLQRICYFIDAERGYLGDMYQPLGVRAYLHEGAEIHEACYGTLETLSRLV